MWVEATSDRGKVYVKQMATDPAGGRSEDIKTIDMSPKEARELSKELLKFADKAEAFLADAGAKRLVELEKEHARLTSRIAEIKKLQKKIK